MHINKQPLNLGLFSGKSGLIILEYLKNTEKITQEINSFVNQISESRRINCTFCSGITGSLWFLEYLKQKNIINLPNDFFKQIDYLVLAQTKYQLQQKNHDYLHGSLGNLLYLYKKIPVKVLSDLVYQLDNIRIEYKKHKIFFMPQNLGNTANSNPQISLGLSHGLPSIMTVLSKFNIYHEIAPLCREIVMEQVSFLFSIENKNKDLGSHSFFPSYIETDKNPTFQSRLAWCYGDLGIANSFYQVGKIYEDHKLINKAAEIFDYYINQKEKIHTGLVDSGICHGIAGVALIYYCAYHQIKNPKYLVEADYWIGRVNEFGQFNKKSNKLEYWRYNNEKFQFEENHNFLEGTLGVECIKQTIIKRITPSWAECLLLF